MSLLTPVWLLLGALAAYVLFLHMRRRRQLDVPSVMIWRLMENTVAPHRSLRWPPPSVLLALQLIIIALVAFALAQPFFGASRGSDDHTIYVLDGSASMRATDEDPSRFDAAVAWLDNAVRSGGLAAGARVSVVSASANPQVVVARQSTTDAIVPLVDALRPTDGIVDWAATAALVAPLIGVDENAVVVVLTDGTDVVETSFADLLPGTAFERAVFGTETAANIGLVADIAPSEEDAGTWTITGSVLFGAAELNEVRVQVLFQPEGTNAFVNLAEELVARPAPRRTPANAEPEPPAVEATVLFTIDMQLPGVGAVMVTLPDDVGPADNAVRFIIRSEPVTARILYIGEPTVPLLAALQAIDNVELVGATDLPANDRDYDLIVVDGVTVARQPETNVFWVGAGRVASQPEPGQLANPDVIGWDANHYLTAQVDWTAVGATSAYRFPRLSGATVLAESGGAPLVQARTTRFGREIRVAFDIGAAAWPSRSGFPVFVSHVVSWLGVNLGATSVPACLVGDPCPIEARLVSGTVTDATGATVWQTQTAGTDFLLPGVERTFLPTRAGYYTLSSGDETRDLIVNPVIAGENALAPREANVETVTSDGTGFQAWWILLAIALVLLLVEAGLAGRGSEQFLRRAALSRTNPLSTRRRVQLGFRIAAIVLLIGAIAGLPWLGREPVEDVVVVMGSDLGGASPERDRLLAQVNDNIADGGRGGFIQTGDANLIAADVGRDTAALGAEALANGTPGTNLEEAMLLAAAMLPANHNGRMVLATDGNETAGELVGAITALQARGITVDIQPVTDMPVGEVLIENVSAPERVFAGDTFKLDAIIYSQGAATADLVIRRAGEIIGEQTTQLLAGRNRIEIPMIPAGPAGGLLMEVSVTSTGDTYAENNSNGVIVNVAETPSILIVTRQPPLGEYFSQALSVQGLTATIATPAEAPNTIDGWLAYDTVIMMNVPAIGLDTTQQEQIEDYVQVHGRGLLILGGENTFGPGGYYETPFERLSPLSSRVPHELPLVAIVYVLDRSGSMSASVGEVNRLDIAKSATVNAASLLSPESRVSVVVFDSSSYVLLPLTERRDDAAVAAALAPLVPGGGTSIYPGLEAALAQLSGVDAAARHIVLMTDGLTTGADFGPLLQQAERAGVTVSTVGIGIGADERRLVEIAERGGGTFHATQDFRALPSILAQETLMLAGSPFKERIGPVTWVDRDFDFLAGLPDQMPPVYSYVVTTPKAEADIHLAVLDEAGAPVPLLATWRYGNGKVLALATHGAGAGTAEWIQMPEYPLMWSQIIRAFLPDTTGPGLNLVLERVGDTVKVHVDLLDPAGAPLEGRVVATTATAANGTELSVGMTEAAPGRYEGTFTTRASGAYHVTATSADLTADADLYVAYPARFNFGRADFDKLQALAAATGGQVLLGDEPVFNNDAKWVAVPGWRLWALLGLLLFLGDLTVRHSPNLFGLLKRRPTRTASPAFALPA